MQAYCIHNVEGKLLQNLISVFVRFKTVMIEFICPQCHHIVINFSSRLQGLVKLIIGDMESINHNKRWPKKTTSLILGQFLNKHTE